MVQLTADDIAYQKAHIQDDRQSDIIISHAICLSLAAIAVVLRFISRRIGKVSLERDDYMITAALIFAAGEVTGGLLSVHYGGGKHAILITQPEAFAKVVLATEVLYNPSICSVKLSILFLYRRIFPSRPFRIILYVVGTIVFTYSWINIITVIFQCRPIQAAWDMAITDATCVHVNIEIVVFAVLNCVTDLVTISLPMPLLWGLNLPLRKRLQLMALFLAGSFVCVVGIYRIPTQAKISFTDASWSDVDAAVWSVVEVCIGIVAACLPTYRPLFLRLFGKGIINGSGPFSQLNTDSSKKRTGRKSGGTISEGSYAEGSRVLRKPERMLSRREDSRTAIRLEELNNTPAFAEGKVARDNLDPEERGRSLEAAREKEDSRAVAVRDKW